MQPDIREALRYLGMRDPDSDSLIRMQHLADELTAQLQPRWMVREYDLVLREDGVWLPDADLLLTGRSAERMLRECRRAALLVCTLGIRFDTMLRYRQQTDMTAAVMLDACGSAYVEAGCDEIERLLSASHPDLYLTDRFSPGYGDLPLSVQKQLLAATDAQRRLGVTLLPSDLMNPSKTVTAVIGLSDRPQKARIRGCAYCRMAGTCTFRKRGVTCDD